VLQERKRISARSTGKIALMSYLVLARKYRPQTFADMVGQENATRTLQGALRDNRVGHAYLFSGPRGTGKTTIARILAKALNCEKGPAIEPCNACERCLSADEGSEIDLVEIDAASNTGVDDVRLLRDQVAYAPMRARFRIYIVDEVHMLSRGAFNAFLKTLEEPPPHVKFLFATTDPQKLPETIVSRCQVIKLAPLPEKVIAARLDHVFSNEGVNAAPGVAAEIARRVRGGMRDALSMADQLLSLVGMQPTVEDVDRLSEGQGVEELDHIVDCIAAHDRKGVLLALPTSEGSEGELLAALLEHVRSALIVLLVGPENPIVSGGPDRARAMLERARPIGVERLQTWLEELLQARERVRLLPNHARAVLEVTLLDLCREETSLALDEIAARLSALEQRVSAPAGAREPASTAEVRRSSDPVPPRTSDPSGDVEAHGTLQPAPRPPARERPPEAARTVAEAPLPTRAPAPESARTAAPTTARAPAPAPTRVPIADTARAPVRESKSREGAEIQAEKASSDAPPTEPVKSARTPAERPKPRLSGTHDAWARFLEVLAETSGSLAETLRARGKLADLANGRAVVQLSNLREHERAQVHDARSQRAVTNAFTQALGAPHTVVLEDQSSVRAHKDAYTQKVAELFDGRIEDEG
jgi:DNA polymerase-3 subunit gamma/tau